MRAVAGWRTRPPTDAHTVERPFANFEEAFRAALDAFDEHGPSLADAGIEAIGHRVVHGGARFAEPAWSTTPWSRP